MKLIKSFFNLFNSKIERKIRTKRLLLRLRRLSLNKIFVSDGEFKHTNNKVTITLYIFNRIKKLGFFNLYTSEQNNMASKIIRESKMKILLFLRKAEQSESTLFNLIKEDGLKKIFNNNSAIYLRKYIENFYKKYAKKSLIYLKTFFYYKQLVLINRTKFSYTYLKHLKNY